jgi:hypothetical protein
MTKYHGYELVPTVESFKSFSKNAFLVQMPQIEILEKGIEFVQKCYYICSWDESPFRFFFTPIKKIRSLISFFYRNLFPILDKSE